MSLDKLAIIFLIIIVPIGFVLGVYTKTQTDTLLAGKVDNSTLNDYYTKTRADELLNTKVDKTTYNSKIQEIETDYVKNTDYATSSKGGVIKVNSPQGTAVYSSGVMYALTRDYNTYINDSNGLFVSKGTLENVITVKDLTTKAYVDGLVGNIESILEELDIGGGI